MKTEEDSLTVQSTFKNIVNGNTFFPRKDIHEIVWRSPSINTLNQINHVRINTCHKL